MFAAVKAHLYQNRYRLNLATKIVPDPDTPELDDIHVIGVTFKEAEGDRILFRAAVQSDVILRGKGRRDYEEDMVSPWFSVDSEASVVCVEDLAARKPRLDA